MIKESVFRRILREESYRILREQDATAAQDPNDPAAIMGFKSKEDVQTYINNIDSMLAPGGTYDPNLEWSPGRKIGENDITRQAFQALKTVLQIGLSGKTMNGTYQIGQAQKMWNMTKQDSAVSKITPEEFDKVIRFYKAVYSKAYSRKPIFNF